MRKELIKALEIEEQSKFIVNSFRLENQQTVNQKNN